jgi:hypothetical protein
MGESEGDSKSEREYVHLWVRVCIRSVTNGRFDMGDLCLIENRTDRNEIFGENHSK